MSSISSSSSDDDESESESEEEEDMGRAPRDEWWELQLPLPGEFRGDGKERINLFDLFERCRFAEPEGATRMMGTLTLNFNQAFPVQQGWVTQSANCRLCD